VFELTNYPGHDEQIGPKRKHPALGTARRRREEGWLLWLVWQSGWNRNHCAPGLGLALAAFAASWHDLGMLTRLMATLNPRRRMAHSPQGLGRAFFERFAGRTILVHDGLGIEWMQELLSMGGGGSHLRFDVRQTRSQPPKPLEWVIQEHILPLTLPLPLLLKIGSKTILVRHLVRHGATCHPGDIAWMLDEIERRFHTALHMEPGLWRIEAGLPPADNEVELPY